MLAAQETDDGKKNIMGLFIWPTGVVMQCDYFSDFLLLPQEREEARESKGRSDA